jgi:hypothetical protein
MEIKPFAYPFIAGAALSVASIAQAQTCEFVTSGPGSFTGMTSPSCNRENSCYAYAHVEGLTVPCLGEYGVQVNASMGCYSLGHYVYGFGQFSGNFRSLTAHVFVSSGFNTYERWGTVFYNDATNFRSSGTTYCS